MLLGVDVGGTFTDAVLVGADGAVFSAKVPTTPADQAQGVLAAVHDVLARAQAAPQQVRRFAHGMTVATNALLEGKTARTALVATAGFTDVVELGRQARPHLYRLCEAAPAPLVEPQLRFAAPERCVPEGTLRELSPAGALALVQEVARAQPEAVAVALLHSYAHPEHERRLGDLLREALARDRVHVSLSSELVGTFREYERTATTVLDAALGPLVGSYLRRLARESDALGLPEPEIMQSSGGLADGALAADHAALTVLSGPAGGVGGALLLADLAGLRDVLCFDMGGTSCDVCLISDGRVAETSQRTVAGRPLALPTLDIATVGSGGGSIAWRDAGGALRVGPQSAGAVPGPACYGRGGEQPTVTDANLLLDRLPADTRLAGTMTLDRAAAERAVAGLGRQLGLDTGACAGGDRARRRGRDAARAARDDGRARNRPAGLCADGLRRRGPAACLLTGRGARHRARPLPAGLGRALCARSRGRRATPRRVAHRHAQRQRAVPRAPGGRARAPARGRRSGAPRLARRGRFRHAGPSRRSGADPRRV